MPQWPRGTSAQVRPGLFSAPTRHKGEGEPPYRKQNSCSAARYTFLRAGSARPPRPGCVHGPRCLREEGSWGCRVYPEVVGQRGTLPDESRNVTGLPGKDERRKVIQRGVALLWRDSVSGVAEGSGSNVNFRKSPGPERKSPEGNNNKREEEAALVFVWRAVLA